ncbi:MAG: pimeloyl-ACP methyl ester carboxylesterase [Alphaproteobacteria bacterium]|jgi:pimeloyl-ACP methyl ester carboxylesterase
MAQTPQILTCENGAEIAYYLTPGASPGIIFLGGFKSDMAGTKAIALEQHCRTAGRAFLRFDYQGHGQSSGAFTDGCIGDWAGDAIAALDSLTDGPQILVGSSMGGWIMLLAALARRERVAGLIGLAAAPDFTEALMWQNFSPEIRDAIERNGAYNAPTEYGDEPYTITRKLIEEGRNHLLLDEPIALHCPVHLIHGQQDADVPWQHSLRTAEQLRSDQVAITLIKDGDHRLSRDQDLARLCRILDKMCEDRP